MAKRRVPIFKTSPVKSVLIDTEATAGAQVGVNLIGPDGALVTPTMWQAMQSTGSANEGATGGTTDGIDEGAWNLYFTKERAQDAVGGILKNSTNIALSYDDDAPGVTADLTDVTVADGGALKKYGFDSKGRLSGSDDATTDDLPEGADSLYFTDARARSAAVEDTIDASHHDIAPSGHAVANARTVPFYLSDLTYSPIHLKADGTVPFVLADGTPSGVELAA